MFSVLSNYDVFCHECDVLCHALNVHCHVIDVLRNASQFLCHVSYMFPVIDANRVICLVCDVRPIMSNVGLMMFCALYVMFPVR